MNWHDYVRSQLPEITGDAARDEEIVEELAQHLGQRFEEERATGATDAEAFARTTREFRASPQLAAALREADTPRPLAPSSPPGHASASMSGAWQDVRYAVRLLRRSPGFTAAAMLTLALGIGITTAIFSVVDGVLLRPAPFPDGERLAMIWETDRASNTAREPGSFPDFLDFKARSRTMDRIGAFMPFDATLQPDAGEPARVAALAVTPEILEMLGAQPIAGRLLTAADDTPAAPAAGLISERLWRAVYGQRDVVGQTIRINDQPTIVAGVVPTDTDFGIVQILRAADYGGGFATRDARMRVDVWTALRGDARRLPRSTHPLLLVGRLDTNAGMSTAQDELAAIARELEAQYRDDNDQRGVSIQPLQEVVFGPVERPLTMLLAAVALVLAMTCANVANLLLMRGNRRLREVAVRSALGAETGRLVRQFVAENVVLTIGAGVLALTLAFVVLRALVAIAPGDIPRIATVGLDERVMLVAFASAVLIGLVFSLVPITQVRHVQLQQVLKVEERVTGGADARTLRSTLVVVEVALAVVLVTGAGLLIRSFWHLRTTSPGFEVAGVLKAEFQLPQSRYPVEFNPFPTSVGIERFNNELLARISALPGVRSAALAANHPLDGGSASSFLVAGREAEAANWPEISTRRVTHAYFATLGIPLIRGRYLEDRDALPSSPGVVINQAAIDRVLHDDDPVGRQIRFWGSEWTIVGVVGNERFGGIANDAPIAVYVPLRFVPSSAEALIVRTSSDATVLASAVRATIRELDPMLVVFGLEPLDATLSNSLIEQRFLMMLLGLFATLALALAAIGIHGILSASVAQRNREIGIRIALGANGGNVVRGVVAQGVRLTGIGLAVGFALALGLGQFLTGLLFGITATDATTLIAVVVVLGIVATLSVWFPARRAVRVDPLVALRQE